MKQMLQTTAKQKILISACLMGEKVRYNGTDLFIEHPLLKQWQHEGRLTPICPEVSGGMSTPRAPSEIINGNGKTVLSKQTPVIDNTGNDVTQAFILGAHKTLQIAKENHCIAAILTERSPSCGSSLIYDGSFSGQRIKGMGVATALLEQHNIRVFSQEQIEQLAIYLENM